MTMHETGRRARGGRWLVPGLAGAFGLAYLVAGLIGDNVGFGVGGLVVMVAAAVLFVGLSRYSETVSGLRERTDERINQLDRDASLLAGMAVLLAVLAMFVVEVARGQDGSPYYQLGALGGVTYFVALVVLRLRG